MAFVVWWRYRPDKIFAFNALEIVLTVTFFFLSMYLGYYCYRHLPLIDFLPYKVGVNIWEGMHAPAVEPGETETVLVYRNLETANCTNFRSKTPHGRTPGSGSGSIPGPPRRCPPYARL